jgi:AraC-like DNA-binding protein
VVSLGEERYGEIEAIFKRSANRGTHTLPFEQILKVNRDLYILVDAFFSEVKLTTIHKSDWLSDTLSYVSGHLDQKLTIELLAGRVAMHPKHFTRCFRERVGEPPGRYIAKVRIQEATALLMNGIPIQEISERIGFQNTQQFFRFFKQHTGMTPRAYYNSYIKGGKN